MIFIFIHGTFGSPSEAWFPWLKHQLEQLGHTVFAPQFPTNQWPQVKQLSVDDFHPAQSLASWAMTFEKVLPHIHHQKDLCFVGHSLGPLFTLFMVEKYGVSLQNAYFVAPFLRPATQEELQDKVAALIHKANITFYFHDFDFARLKTFIRHSTVIYSDNDPNVHEWEALEFAGKLGSKTIKLTGLGHMGEDANLFEFPQLLHAIKQDNP